MDQKLTVTPSTTLGAGVTSIAPFQLAPRALKVVQFNFGPSFDRTPRTKVGNFVFTGRVGSTVVTEATTRAIIVVRPRLRLRTWCGPTSLRRFERDR